MVRRENPRPGGRLQTWHRSTVENLGEMHVTEGSICIVLCLFGFWIQDRAVIPQRQQKAGKWYGGILEAAEQFMVR